MENKVALDFFKTKYALPAVAAAGLLLAVIIVNISPEIEHVSVGAPPPLAEYIEAKSRPFAPRATGFGFVEPATLLEAGAEVSGRITYLNPRVKAGAFLPEGTDILQIDPTDYELALAEARANLAATKAQKKEQEMRLVSAKIAFEISERNLVLADQGLERKRGLRTKGTISQAALDIEEQSMLQLRQQMQTRLQTLETLPSEIEVASARVKQNQVKLKEAEQRLARTKIQIPFQARIAAVHVDEGEYINLGGKLFDAHSMDAVEISTRLSLANLQNLIAGMQELSVDQVLSTPDELISRLGLKAEVMLPDSIDRIPWPAAVVRLGETQDFETRTLAVVVRVEDPYGRLLTAKRPPLLRGMYVEVNLVGNFIESLVIPRHAVHSGIVYVVGEGDTLILRPVIVTYQGDLAIVQSGLERGDKIILTDLVPAVSGMKIKPQASNTDSVAGNTQGSPVPSGILK
ncbi:MAG: hypothetical protein COB37_07315 [Kordiimonadales bacterium]|nr:MAG: hypothetical protein COB37_07315 [Kordiimonadales bacterium]